MYIWFMQAQSQHALYFKRDLANNCILLHIHKNVTDELAIIAEEFISFQEEEFISFQEEEIGTFHV